MDIKLHIKVHIKHLGSINNNYNIIIGLFFAKQLNWFVEWPGVERTSMLKSPTVDDAMLTYLFCDKWDIDDKDILWHLLTADNAHNIGRLKPKTFGIAAISNYGTLREMICVPMLKFLLCNMNMMLYYTKW